VAAIADRVLAHLAHIQDPPTASEIAHAIGAKPAIVATVVRNLANDGHVAQLGVAFSGARTWALTEAGRAWLAEHDKE
jgi:predicted transcriptional regulator